MPADLPAIAKKEWQRVVPLLKKLGIVNGFDQVALADYCLCVARLAECEAQVTTLGVLIVGERGMVKNPALQLAREYRNHIHKWCSEFGLTASSRGKMAFPEPGEHDPFEDYLNGTDAEDGSDGGDHWSEAEDD